MRLDLLSDDWDLQNKNLADFLSTRFSTEISSLRVYPGLMQAVFETVFGLGLFYSHKKNAAMLRSNTYAFQGVLPYLYKEGFQIQISNLDSGFNAKDFVEGLKKETSFVIYSEDHPVTGECVDHSELDLLLNERKIFSIRVSHHSWKRGLSQLHPYHVRICSIDPEFSFVQFGEKLKSPTMSTQFLDWRNSKIKQALESELNNFSEDQRVIFDFESHLPHDWKKFIEGQSRIFDRAVIYNETLNAEAVLTQIVKNYLPNYQVPLPGYSSQLDCVNFARWKIFGNLDEWWKPLPRQNQIRGMLIVSLELLKKIDLPQALKDIENICRI